MFVLFPAAAPTRSANSVIVSMREKSSTRIVARDLTACKIASVNPSNPTSAPNPRADPIASAAAANDTIPKSTQQRRQTTQEPSPTHPSNLMRAECYPSQSGSSLFLFALFASLR
jgi:hypothetical protein